MKDSLPNMTLQQFELAVLELHDQIQAFPGIVKQLKEVLALQWFLGLIGMSLLFVVGLLAYRFALKAIRAYAPKEYRLPRRWLFTFLGVYLVSLTLFVLLPRWITLDVPHVPNIDSVK